MIDVGLSGPEKRALVRTLARDHMVSVDASILNLERKHLGWLPGRITEGQVNIDAAADVTRQLQLTMVDEDKSLRLDTADGNPNLKRIVRVRYKVHVGNPINDWVAIPIFTGPVTSVEREEGLVTIEAMGMEHLAWFPAWSSHTFEKGRNRVSVIRVLLRDYAGETNFRLPVGWRSRMKRTVTMKQDTPPWRMAKAVAKGARAQLFYDGRGTVRLRKHPVRSSFTFTDGDGGMILTEPKVSESSEDAFNLVKVVGATPEGKKNPLTRTRRLPASHPHSLRRNGVRITNPDVIEDDTLRTQQEVDDAVDRRIREIQLDEQLVTFDALPMPLLEEGDRFVVDAEGAKVTARVSQMSIPLGHEGVSTVGYIARVSARRR